jgi:hypothetical protein
MQTLEFGVTPRRRWDRSMTWMLRRWISWAEHYKMFARM